MQVFVRVTLLFVFSLIAVPPAVISSDYLYKKRIMISPFPPSLLPHYIYSMNEKNHKKKAIFEAGGRMDLNI